MARGTAYQGKRGGKLFLSYSRQNKALVYPFVEALTAAGVEVWIDREEIDPLDDFPARIREGLARVRARLGAPGASRRAAEAILTIARTRR